MRVDESYVHRLSGLISPSGRVYTAEDKSRYTHTRLINSILRREKGAEISALKKAVLKVVSREYGLQHVDKIPDDAGSFVVQAAVSTGWVRFGGWGREELYIDAPAGYSFPKLKRVLSKYKGFDTVIISVDGLEVAEGTFSTFIAARTFRDFKTLSLHAARTFEGLALMTGRHALYMTLEGYTAVAVVDQLIHEVSPRHIPDYRREQPKWKSMPGLPKVQRTAITQHLKKLGLTRKKAVSAVRRAVDAAAVQYGLGPGNVVDAGLAWYKKARSLIVRLAKRYRLPTVNMCAAAAALSPRKKWDNEKNGGENLRLLRQYAEVVTDTKPLKTPRGKIRVQDATPIELHTYHPQGSGHFKTMSLKAYRALRGDVKAASGPKVSSFFHNLADPENSDEVTVDTWMLRLFFPKAALYARGGQRTSSILTSPGSRTGRTESERRLYRAWVAGVGSYPFFQDVLKQVAHERKLQPHKLQSILWGYLKEKYADETLSTDPKNVATRERRRRVAKRRLEF